MTYLGEVTSIKKDKDSTKADERQLKVTYTDMNGTKVYPVLTADDTTGFDGVYDDVKVGDKVLVMEAGRAVQFAEPCDILRNPATEFVDRLVTRKRTVYAR